MIIYNTGDAASYLLYNTYKLILIIISLILIFIPIVKHFLESRSAANPNALFTNASKDTNSKKKKAEKQLLYETVFICCWKAINISLNTYYLSGIESCFLDSLFLLLIDSSIYISNVGGLIMLLRISSVFREGFKQAFKIWENKKVVSISMAFSSNKKTTIGK